MNSSREIGMIVRGSLSVGVEMRLAPAEPVEEVRAGKFVIMQVQYYQFFSMITNVTLEPHNPAILRSPPDLHETLLRPALNGIGTYSSLDLRPMIMLKRSSATEAAKSSGASSL